jgi:hypothetical protein
VEDAVVLDPAKLVRLGDMLHSMLAELRLVNDGAAGRELAAAMHRTALVEIGSALSDDLLNELAILQARSIDGETSCDEVRIALVQLQGWLDGMSQAMAEGRVRIALPSRAPSPRAICSSLR